MSSELTNPKDAIEWAESISDTLAGFGSAALYTSDLENFLTLLSLARQAVPDEQMVERIMHEVRTRSTPGGIDEGRPFTEALVERAVRAALSAPPAEEE